MERLTDYLMNKASRTGIPMNGTFELSPVCNLSCRMCYVRKTQAEVLAHDRPMRTVEQWVTTAEEARDAGLLYLLLTGGEPFLWPGFWPLYEKLAGMGFLISVNSNGTLLEDTDIAKLREKPPLRINVTMYGASDETYERLCQVKGMFSRVDRNIRKLCEAGIQVKLNTSLTPYNACDLEKMQAYADGLGLVFDAAAYMFPPLRRAPDMVGQNERFSPEEAAFYHMRSYRLRNGEEKYREFLKRAACGIAKPPGLDEQCADPVDGRIRCRAGKASFWITWDGWLTPCGMMPAPQVDLQKQDFAHAWLELMDKSAALQLSGVCTQCVNRNMCQACAAVAAAETGTVSGIPQYMCRMVSQMKCLATAVLEGNLKETP